MKRFVWDTSAIINIKEPDHSGYSPGHSLIKDLSDGWISRPYQNIFPTLAVFEVSATFSRMHRDGRKILRDFYLMNENAVLYNIDEPLISKSYELFVLPGFDKLRGADLLFACIAHVENAYLVTLDKDVIEKVSEYVKVIDLNDSHASARYRAIFETAP